MFWQPWSEDALQPPGFFLPPNFRNQCWEISLKKGEMTWRTVGRVCSLVCFDKLRNLSTLLQKMELADETKHWWFNDCFKFTEIARIITRKRLSNWDLQNTVTDLERRITEQEIYSSKDSSIIENSPTKDGIVSISEQVCFFFELRLGYKTFPGRFKAWHYLGTGDKTKPAPVIVKIILASIRVLG